MPNRPVSIGLVVAFVLSPACRGPGVTAPDAGLGELLQRIAQEYEREVPRERLVAAARDAMLAALDPYCSYLDAASYAEMQLALAGAMGGVGMRLDGDGQRGVTIRGPFLGSPAHAAGLVAGDRLLAVGEQPVAGRTLPELLSSLRGAPGSQVSITVQGTGARRTLQLERANLPLPTVRGFARAADGHPSYGIPDCDLAYVRLTGFATTTTTELHQALAAMPTTTKGIVLDLRQNQGGLLRAGVEVADLFLEQGVIVTTHPRSKNPETRHATPGTATRLPLAILIDGETKSAAEVVAACLQDHRRAVVVGTRSFGKSTVQRMFPCANGGAVLLTVEHYVRPSGEPIERHLKTADAPLGGVWPDQGMAIDGDLADASKVVFALLQADDDIGLVGSPVQGLPLHQDPALARACAALTGTR
jgi:carboxyl-terminal processing protease